MGKDEITCIHCGARTGGYNEYMECPRCRREGPGIWAHESKGVFRAIIIIIIATFVILALLK